MSSLLITTLSSAVTTSLTSLWTTTHPSSSLITISTSTQPHSGSLISSTSIVVSSQSSPDFFTSHMFTSINTSELVLLSRTSDSLAILSSSVATVYSFSSSSITTKSSTLSITTSKSKVHSSVIPSPSSVFVSISLTVYTNSLIAPIESAVSSTSKAISVLISPTATSSSKK